MDRRKFLKIMGMGAAAAAIPWRFDPNRLRFMEARAYAFAQSPIIPKFTITLPPVGAGIPVASGSTASFQGLTTDFYNLTVKQFTQQVHPALPGPTTFWGYSDNATGTNKYLGPIIVANRNRPILLSVTNGLITNAHILPVDLTLPATETQNVGQLGLYNRIATHLHGGLTPWFSDGTPF